jgi:hypothetical protein
MEKTIIEMLDDLLQSESSAEILNGYLKNPYNYNKETNDKFNLEQKK